MLLLLVRAAAAEPAPTPPLTSAMHARYAALTSARDAVIAGNLDAVRTALAPLASADPDEPLPEVWRPLAKPVERAAARAAASRDLAQAALGVARVAAACAECHGATAGGPDLDASERIPPQAWQPGQNMALHQWATDRMWVGLIAGDEAAWTLGAEELDRRPIELRFEEATPPGGKPQLEQLVYILADRALAADAPSERAEVFGNLLAVCSQCHVQPRENR